MFNPAGSGLVYSTYLGGSSWDSGEGIAVDGTGQVYVTGGTGSGDFPTRDPVQPAIAGDVDAFITVFNPAGSGLVYSTYLGGSNRDEGLAIAVDGAGNAYVTGSTGSTNFPTANPFQPTYGGTGDTFVAKIGELVGACTVTSTADSGPGTLRACLENASSGDQIVFETTVFRPFSPATIALTSGPLPDMAQGNLTVDASNAGVILDGSGLSSGAGFRITSDGNALRGMQILNFPGDGVEICCGARNNTVGGDRRLGTKPLGQGNLISGNGVSGVSVHDSGTVSNTVSGNFIGPDATLLNPLGNALHGVYVHSGAQNNQVGGSGNTIAYNHGDGVRVKGSTTTGNTITQNSIYENAGQGIENLDGGGGELTPPALVGAAGNRVAGTAPAASAVEIFGDDGDEGRFFLGSTAADAAGHFEFAAALMGLHVTATATDGAGNTSECSAPVVQERTITDTFETNDDWTLAYPISEGDWVSYISSPTDVAFYRLPVPPRGPTVIFTLTDLTADDELVLLAPTAAPLYTPLT